MPVSVVYSASCSQPGRSIGRVFFYLAVILQKQNICANIVLDWDNHALDHFEWVSASPPVVVGHLVLTGFGGSIALFSILARQSPWLTAAGITLGHSLRRFVPSLEFQYRIS